MQSYEKNDSNKITFGYILLKINQIVFCDEMRQNLTN